MPKFVDLTGSSFGRLLVTTRAPSVAGRTYWTCRCCCGGEINVRQDHLRDCHVRSCGCLYRDTRSDEIGERSKTHGMRSSVEYKAYAGAKDRCSNPRHPFWHGRGIEFRFASFEEFYAEIGPKPEWAHSVDRKSNDGHYEIGNIRWATAKTQALNTRRNLSEDDVREIRRLRASGTSCQVLASMFQCSRQHVHHIATGAARQDVKDSK